MTGFGVFKVSFLVVALKTFCSIKFNLFLQLMYSSTTSSKFL